MSKQYAAQFAAPARPHSTPTPKRTPRAQPRHVPGAMNKTEAAFAQVLEARLKAGEIVDYRFESLTLKLGADCRYTPDFVVVNADYEIELYDVKGGFTRDDSAVKMRVCAYNWPFPLYIVTGKREKSGYLWTQKMVGK